VFSIRTELSESRRLWQGKPWVQLIAVAIGVIPLYSRLLMLPFRGDQAISTQEFIFSLAVVAPLTIMIALLLLRFLCGESPRELNLRPGKLSTDLLATLILCTVIMVTNITSTFFLSGLFRESASNTSVRALFAELAGNPKLLVLFVGLLMLLGATSEELIRVFLLSRLWKVWSSSLGKLIAIVVSAVLFGLVHLYQGPTHAVWAGIFGLITALYYLRFGRVAPLVLAHYVTNAIQVIVFASRAQ